MGIFLIFLHYWHQYLKTNVFSPLSKTVTSLKVWPLKETRLTHYNTSSNRPELYFYKKKILVFGADEQNKLYVTNLFKQKMIIKKTLQKAGERCILCKVLDSLAGWLHVQVPPPHTQYVKYLKQSRSFVLCRCICCTRILSCDFSFSEV